MKQTRRVDVAMKSPWWAREDLNLGPQRAKRNPTKTTILGTA